MLHFQENLSRELIINFNSFAQMLVCRDVSDIFKNPQGACQNPLNLETNEKMKLMKLILINKYKNNSRMKEIG